MEVIEPVQMHFDICNKKDSVKILTTSDLNKIFHCVGIVPGVTYVPFLFDSSRCGAGG